MYDRIRLTRDGGSADLILPRNLWLDLEGKLMTVAISTGGTVSNQPRVTTVEPWMPVKSTVDLVSQAP